MRGWVEIGSIALFFPSFPQSSALERWRQIGMSSRCWWCGWDQEGEEEKKNPTKGRRANQSSEVAATSSLWLERRCRQELISALLISASRDPKWKEGTTLTTSSSHHPPPPASNFLPFHRPQLIDVNDPPEWRPLVRPLMKKGGREEKGGDRWGGQEASSPEARNMVGLHLLPLCPPPTPPLSWEGSDGLFITPPAAATWTPWLLIRARHCSGLGACACTCVCVCVCVCVVGGRTLYSSQVFINAADIECRWTLDWSWRGRTRQRHEMI